jgi:hypothetical protein
MVLYCTVTLLAIEELAVAKRQTNLNRSVRQIGYKAGPQD